MAYTEYPWDARVRREAEALAADGWEVHAITARSVQGPSQPGGIQVHLHELPITVKRGGIGRYLFQYGAFLLLSSALLAALQIRSAFEVVHVHTLPDFQVFAAFFPKALRSAILLDMHEAMPELFLARLDKSPKSRSYRLLVALQKLSCGFADHIVVACESIKSSLVASGVPESKVTTVPNLPEPRTAGRPADIRAHLNLPAGELIVHAGGLNQERDLGTLVRAVAKVAAHRDVSLVLAGAGDRNYIDSLLQLGIQLGIGERVRYVGRLSPSEAEQLMALSGIGLVTLVANPHTQLSLPARLADFARMGKPFVVADLRFLREFLGSAGEYYLPGNADSLAAGIERGLDADRLPEGRVEAAKRISRYFDPSRVRASLRDVYRHLEVPAHG